MQPSGCVGREEDYLCDLELVVVGQGPEKVSKAIVKDEHHLLHAHCLHHAIELDKVILKNQATHPSFCICIPINPEVIGTLDLACHEHPQPQQFVDDDGGQLDAFVDVATKANNDLVLAFLRMCNTLVP